MDSHHPVDKRAIERKHEHSDILAGPIVKSGIAFAILILVGMGLIYVLFQYFAGAATAEDVARQSIFTQPDIAPKPHLQVNEKADYQEFRKQAEESLNSYGWVDKSNGIAHIPIDRAMDILVQRGVPVREGGK